MINTDEDALICDLAETYKIYDYRSLPCKTVAALSFGLRNNSRIKMKLSGTSITTEEMLLAAIVDNTRMVAWLLTKDASSGLNRPKSLLSKLMGNTENSDIVAFESGDDFDKEWKRRNGGE